MEKYFLRRIQKRGGSFIKGVEVHDSLDAAKLSFWGRMKTGYGKDPEVTFVHCWITDGSGRTVEDYNMSWRHPCEKENMYFLHHIRLDGSTFGKDVDIREDYDIACADFAAYMEYGYDNPKFPGVSYVSTQITDLLSGGLELMGDTWERAAEPEPEPAPEAGE